MLEALRSQVLTLSPLPKFAIVLAVIVGVPPLARRVRLPEAVGLLLFGVVLGPRGLGLFGENRPIADFFAELGKLLLMFSVGLEIDVALFRKVQARAIGFGLWTTLTPLLLTAALALALGSGVVPAIAVGSLIASQTLIGLAPVRRLGGMRLEPVVVTIGATVVSDTLSLLVFALCVSTFESGFSAAGLGRQLAELALFVPVILFGLGRAGASLLRRTRSNEELTFVLMVAIMATAGALADFIHLPGIVGAFLAGFAVNVAVEDNPARSKVDFLGKALFIPCFFVATGFLIEPAAFARGIVGILQLGAGLVAALLVGKWIAAAAVSRMSGYTPAARGTMWALTLPQVAATLAATIVAHHTVNRDGRRLLDGTTLDAVLVVILVTSILGPFLTERFAARMVAAAAESKG